MLNIAILCPSVLPVPAVRGGAVETIIDGLVRENENNPKMHFTVFSEYDDLAEKESRSFKYTDFVYIKTNRTLEKWYYIGYRGIKKLFKIALPDNLARKKMVELINPDDFDWILYQAGEVFSLKCYKKKLPAEKMLVHAHGMITPIPSVDKYFSFFLPISKFVGDYWAEKSNRSASTYKVWQNCIQVKNFERRSSAEEKRALMDQLGICDSDFSVIFTGRIIPEKGVLELLRSLNYLNDEKIKLIVVGSAKFAENSATSYEKEVQKEVERLGNQVVFTGYIPNTELYRYYQIADIAVVPSIWDEPAGLVVIEAMAAGKAVITTGSGGIKEYINDEVAIFVNRGEMLSKEIADAIQYLKEHPEVRKIMEKKANLLAQHYDMSQYLVNFENIIKEISGE